VNVINVHVPGLRERGSDVLLLAQHFLARLIEKSGSKVSGFTTEAAAKLMDYHWPGNVRELENAIERAVTLARYEQISVEDLPENIRAHETTRSVLGETDPDRMPPIEHMERSYIHQVLRAVDGNKSRAARILGLDRRTLYRKLERYHAEMPPAA
jgi:two-component system response regulator HydG